MFETLSTIGMLASFYLFLAALNDTLELNDQKSEERREKYRKRAYAEKRRQWTINQNRRRLWAEVNGNENYFNR